MKNVKIGIVGIGCISTIYLENITKRYKELEIVGVCDLVRERAEIAAENYGIGKIYDTMHDMFSDPEIEMVLNLTRPYEHYEVSKAALLAGKHVYCEKPLAVDMDEGRELVALAEKNSLMLGGAPDTFLGDGIQSSRRLIDMGMIGEPVGSAAFLRCHGHETWHPDPEFYYKRGGGPLFDMGPYYITALINLLGGVSRVSGVTRTAFKQRLITSEPHYGEIIDVDVPTYITGTLEYDSGIIGTLFFTFDIYHNDPCRLEIYGTEGTLIVPDPNTFGGPIKLVRPGNPDLDMPMMMNQYDTDSRGLGLLDMSRALRTGEQGRTTYKQTEHVLEIMCGIIESGNTMLPVKIKSKYTRTAPLSKQ